MILSAFSTNSDKLLYNLGYDIQSAMWFDNNYEAEQRKMPFYCIKQYKGTSLGKSR